MQILGREFSTFIKRKPLKQEMGNGVLMWKWVHPIKRHVNFGFV